MFEDYSVIESEGYVSNLRVGLVTDIAMGLLMVVLLSFDVVNKLAESLGQNKI